MNVYYLEYDENKNKEKMSDDIRYVFEYFIKKEDIKLNDKIPLKVHFGEEGNKTFIKPKNYEGLIDYLKNNNIETFYIETNVLYKGKRQNATDHLKVSKEHGFDNLPVVFADGENGEDFKQIGINKKHFSKCLIGKEFEKYSQLIVLSHFKGHTLAGFGGAIKQLGMGFASRGGKLAQHVNSKPFVIGFMCEGCMACKKTCPVLAISTKNNKKAHIDKDKCIGCGSCISVCPENAIKVNYLTALKGSFQERLAEYAYGANLNKNNIFISIAVDITKRCDCEGKKMEPFVEDVGILISKDPVAIDQAAIDIVNRRNKRKVFKRGKKTLKHAKKIGLGKRDYTLIEI